MCGLKMAYANDLESLYTTSPAMTLNSPAAVPRAFAPNDGRTCGGNCAMTAKPPSCTCIECARRDGCKAIAALARVGIEWDKLDAIKQSRLGYGLAPACGKWRGK